jgi:hypothetical protein
VAQARAKYVMKSMEVERKRKARDGGEGKRLSVYEEVISWDQRAVDTDIADAITPCREQQASKTPGEESSLKKCRTSAHNDLCPVVDGSRRHSKTDPGGVRAHAFSGSGETQNKRCANHGATANSFQ